MDLLYALPPLALYLALLLWISLTTRAAGDDTAYFLAGRNIAPWAAFVSVVATETSVATIIIFPAVGLKSGLSLIWLCLGYILGRSIVAVFYLRPVYAAHSLSMYTTISGSERSAGNVLSLFYLLSKFISSGVRLYMGGFALNQLFPWSVGGWIVVTALVAGAYSLSGGLRAVIVTDQLQGYVILAFGVGLCFYLSGESAVGLPAFINTEPSYANAGHWAALLIGGAVLSIGTHGADQDMLQRLFAVRDASGAARAMILSALGATVVILLYLYVGHLLGGLGPEQRGDGRSPLVGFIARLNSPFAAGLFAVLVAAAAMSTLDSALHSTGAVWKSLFRSDSGGRAWSILSLLCLTLAALIFIPAGKKGDFLGLALGSMNYVNGGLIAALSVFVFFPAYRSGPGLIIGLLTGMGVTLFCAHWLKPALAWPWTTVLSAGLALGASLIPGALRRVGSERA